MYLATVSGFDFLGRTHTQVFFSRWISGSISSLSLKISVILHSTQCFGNAMLCPISSLRISSPFAGNEEEKLQIVMYNIIKHRTRNVRNSKKVSSGFVGFSPFLLAGIAFVFRLHECV